MKTTTLILAAILFIATSALRAQTGDIVTMKTSRTTPMSMKIKYTGTGSIEANGASLLNDNYRYDIVPAADSSITITTTGDIILTFLEIYGADLIMLDVSKAVHLSSLICFNNHLTELDVTNNPGLVELRCEMNQLSKLDVTKNTSLSRLRCEINKLTELDITNNTKLTILSCYMNQLKELDITQNTILITLRCNDNSLSSLDLRQNRQLTDLFAENQTVEIPILGNATTFPNPFSYHNKLGLENVRINDTAYAFGADVPVPSEDTARFTTAKTTAYGNAFSGTIKFVRSSVSINEVKTAQLSVYPNPTTGIVNIIAKGNPEVRIYNIHGQLVCIAYGTTINLSDLVNGVYILQVEGKRTRVIKN